MKKSMFICLFFITNFIIINVNAADYTCSYSGNSNGSNLSANIIIYESSSYNDLPFLGQSLIFDNEVTNTLNIYNYSAEWAGGGFQWPNLYNSNDINTLKSYYTNIGSCPPFLAVFKDPLNSDLTIKSGVLTDYSDIKTNTGLNPLFILELLNPDAGDSEVDDVAKACEFNFLLESGNKEETLIVDYTLFSANKTVTSSSAIFVGDTSPFFSNGLNCLEKVYVCVFNGIINYKHPIFVSANQETMKSQLFQTLTLFDLSNDSDLSYGFSTYEDFCDSNCDFENDLRETLLIDCGVVSSVPDDQTTIKLGKGGCTVFQNFVDSINSEDQYSIAYNKFNNLKTYCNSVIKNANFSSKKGSCVYRCLNIGDEIDLSRFSIGSSECGFSQKLAIYIANIIKWVKYIIPVIVIVLGILDFIKAVGADKDDEIKKAQGRFVKRLIAAALIFIVPFIIEFVLNKMGFDSNGCGIIDL